MATEQPPAERRVESPLLSREMAVSDINAEARTFDVVWSTGSPVDRRDWWTGGKFTETLDLGEKAVRLERLNSGNAPLLDSHDTWTTDARLGVIVAGSAKVDGKQGRATIRMMSQGIDPRADMIFAKVKDGILRSVSVGYVVHTWEETHKDGVLASRVARDWEPYEISLVPIPADPDASVRASKRSFPCTVVTAKPAQKEIEMSAADETGDRKPEVKEEKKPDAVTERKADPVVDTRAIDPAAFKVVARGLGLTDTDAITAMERAQKGDETLDAWRDRMLTERAKKADETAVSSVHVTRDNAETVAAGIEEALCARAGVKGKDGKPIVLDKGLAYRGLTLIEMGREYLDAHGQTTRGKNSQEVASMMVRAPGYHGTGDFSNLLGNTANRTLRDAYEAQPQTFKPWTRGITLPDFKSISVAALAAAPMLLEVPEHGEFKYATMSDAAETMQLKTYGIIFAITRQALINDDLAALTRMPQIWGVSAANKESDLVYAVLTDNAAMADSIALFHSSHGNIGTAGAISETTLKEAFEKFGAQTGPGGVRINVRPKYLLVGSGKEFEAKKIMMTVQPKATADVNLFQNSLEVIVDPRISGTKWFIAADPAVIDTVTHAHLAGQEGVYTERREGFNVDGTEFKARLDFVAKALDYRGLFYNAGS